MTSDPIHVELTQEEAEVLRSIEAPAGPARFKCPECREIAEKAWRRDFALHNAAVAKLRTALDNPQPNTERYEEALRIYADSNNWTEADERSCGCTFYTFQHPDADGKLDGGYMARAALQGEKHGE